MIVKRRAQSAGLINDQTTIKNNLNIHSSESRNPEDRWIPIFIDMETNIRDI